MKLLVVEIIRYAISGVVATAVHYGVLTTNIELLAFESVGLANFVAALFGITASFLGSRYFVFRSAAGDIIHQVAKFGIFYGLIAVLHGVFLWGWSDWQNLDYRLGFVVATGFQVSLSYLGNKFLVFKA
ncbi:GtrA family protein [Aromatoleum toluclasticum]|uniref:GtrA family protein n=1 Tax=Aromatoleum toluclasticum TaxID=92003 RepID=UPI001D17F1FA|nr:GtrA family protein [Aromatoleum toluclasticum]MCC4117946.1 GtrA family protein [Aromatoleum toluclasticum]